MLIFEIRRPDLKKKREQKEVRTALTVQWTSFRCPRARDLKAKLSLSHVATRPFVLGKTSEFDFVLLPEITWYMLCILIYP